MIEKVSHVRNPLTVIAIFAGLAEVSGTVVLPFLTPNTQNLYVWFLMGFPCLLVVLFFSVLYFKHFVLYAPTDFRDDDKFMKFVPSSPAVILQKRAEEIQVERVAVPDLEQELVPDQLEEGSHEVDRGRGPMAGDIDAMSIEVARSRADMSEELVLAKLSRTFNVVFQRNVSPKGMPNLSFDAAAIDEHSTTILEIKYTRRGSYPSSFIKGSFERAMTYYTSLPTDAQSRFFFIVAIVIDSDDAAAKEKVMRVLRRVAGEYPFKSSPFVFSFSGLEDELRDVFGANSFETLRKVYHPKHHI